MRAPSRTTLPYGAVMATAGASTLAGRCGLPALLAPLLALAILQAVTLPAVGVVRCGCAHQRWHASLVPGSLGEQAGMHTVPLGLAVIASGLAGASQGPSLSWTFPAATLSLLLAWLLTILCSAWFLRTLVAHGAALQELDGTWFLVPAALLGAAMATLDVGALIGRPPALDFLALGASLIGWLGYWAVALGAAIRVHRAGLGEAPRSPWWIAMGCAGLAAAAFGQLLDPPLSWAPWLTTILAAAMGVAALSAVVLAVPVAALSLIFLVRYCRFQSAAAWPPTFSTAVFALGCLEAGTVLRSLAFRHLGLGAGFATIALWAVTAAWNTLHRAGLRFRAN